MFQSFETTADPTQGPARLNALRAEMTRAGVDAFLVPRADLHQGEYVAARDARLAWLTGFTGSAGFCAVLHDRAGVFIDGRYRTQVKLQVDTDHFTPVPWPETQLADWLIEHLPKGATVAFDPWLHTGAEVEKLEEKLHAAGLHAHSFANLVDAIWPDQPDRPAAPVTAYPKELAGKGDETKRAEIAAAIREKGAKATVLTLPDSICWLLNIRGQDVAHNPIVHALAILHDDGTLDLFSTPAKFAGLGPDPAITLHDWDAFEPALKALAGPVQLDPGTCPAAVFAILNSTRTEILKAPDPCALPKACKNPTEIAAARTAHDRDASAMCRFLAWLDATPKDSLTEIDVVTKLEGFRRETGALKDISFETIAGSGPNAAIMHYRVTEGSNRALTDDRMLLVDSGGQYLDGTTDITRTIQIGQATPEERRAFTRVLQGMIALSRAKFPKGVAGAHLDAIARAPLWADGRDFDHGTGHGVGQYLSVHEGPQRISRVSTLPLQPGMIVSNEPGNYVEGQYGIRLENLIVVKPAEVHAGGDPGRELLSFETLTYVPLDRRLIEADLLGPEERDWLNAYHAECRARVEAQLDAETRAWLADATAPI